MAAITPMSHVRIENENIRCGKHVQGQVRRGEGKTGEIDTRKIIITQCM